MFDSSFVKLKYITFIVTSTRSKAGFLFFVFGNLSISKCRRVRGNHALGLNIIRQHKLYTKRYLQAIANLFSYEKNMFENAYYITQYKKLILFKYTFFFPQTSVFISLKMSKASSSSF